MRKYQGKWTVWPCLCGFDGNMNQIWYHQRSCEVWKTRDVAAVRKVRIQKSTGHKTLPSGPRCRFCNAAKTHHKPDCPGRRRGPRFASVEVWQAFLRVLKKHYEETGRGAELMAKFD